MAAEGNKEQGEEEEGVEEGVEEEVEAGYEEEYERREREREKRIMFDGTAEDHLKYTQLVEEMKKKYGTIDEADEEEYSPYWVESNEEKSPNNFEGGGQDGESGEGENELLNELRDQIHFLNVVALKCNKIINKLTS